MNHAFSPSIVRKRGTSVIRTNEHQPDGFWPSAS